MAIPAQTLTLGPWMGGVRYDKSAEDCESNEMASMSNVRIDERGQAESRGGWDPYRGESALNSNATITGCGEHRFSSSSERVWVIAGNKFYEYNSGYTDRTGGQTITAAADNVFESASDLGSGKLLLTNGVNAPLVWSAAGGNLAAADVDSKFTTAKHVAFWNNRAWWGNTNAAEDAIWRSDTGNVTVYSASTADHLLGVPHSGFAPFGNALSIHSEEGIWTLTPTGNATVPYQQQQRTQQGSLSGRAIVTIPGGRQLFIRRDGIYMWRGGDSSERQAALGNRYWDTVNTGRLEFAHAVYYPLNNEVWFHLPTGTTSSGTHEIVIYRVDLDCWFGPYEGDTFNCSALIDNKPHAGDDNGVLWDLNTGDNDNNAAIDAWYTTGAPAPEGESTMVRWLYCKSYFENRGNWEVSIQQESSGIEGTYESINMGAATGSVLDTGLLDAFDLSEASTLLHEDTDLSGFDPHSYLTVRNANKDEPFGFRHHHLNYKVLGKKRKRKAGVE